MEAMMSNNDIAIAVSGLVSGGASISRKPPYLVLLKDGSGKTAMEERFISLDKPELLNGFIQVKGIYCEVSESKIIATFNDILSNSPKENIVEMLFPNHRISSIRSLAFSAVKNVSPTR
jgi:hypothetical protein